MGQYGHFSKPAAGCRAVAFCPCCSRVELSQSPELCWFCVARKTAGHPPLLGTDPEAAVPAWAHDTDGAGPALLSPDGAPVRWLLMDATYTASATTRTTRPGGKAAGRQ